MSLILGVDTSSAETSIAVIRDDDVVVSWAQAHRHPPSDSVFPILAGLLEDAGLAVDDFAAFAACIGPGSFTGLRIGLVMAKGFAFATGRPLFGYDAVEIAAARARTLSGSPAGTEFVAAVAAFKGTVFHSPFAVAENGELERRGELAYTEGHGEFLAGLAPGTPVFAAGRDAADGSLGTSLDGAPSAAEMIARRACADLAAGLRQDFDAVRPLYLKPFSIGKKARALRDFTS